MSRPIRAIVLVLALWCMGRTAAIWSESILPLAETGVTIAQAETSAHIATMRPVPFVSLAAFERVEPNEPTSVARPRPALIHNALPTAPVSHRHDWVASSRLVISAAKQASSAPPDCFTALATTTENCAPEPGPSMAGIALDGALATPSADHIRRLSISTWTLVRGDSAQRSLGPAGQLGGSQAGARILYALNPVVALTGRISAPLAQRSGREASAGIALRYRSLALLAERRIALDRGGRNDFTLTATAGIDAVDLPAHLRLDGYAQAGLVGSDGFADGAVRVERTVLTRGALRLSGGAGGWGGIQPGAARIDIGPQIALRLPAPSGTLRIAAEWRVRVAGDARPGSGPTLSIGGDF